VRVAVYRSLASVVAVDGEYDRPARPPGVDVD
jgi:hypothetical protein